MFPWSSVMTPIYSSISVEAELVTHFRVQNKITLYSYEMF